MKLTTMKLTTIPTLLLASTLLATQVAIASDSVDHGDLVVVFYKLDSSNVVGENYYVVNLGPASLFRENTQNNVPVTSINTALGSASVGVDLALDSTFGSNWYNDNAVRWLVVGTVAAGQPVVNGDPARTNYYSAPRASLGSADSGANSTIATISPSNRGTLSTQIYNFLMAGSVNDAIGGINNNASTSGTNPASAIIPSANPKPSVDEYMPPVTTTSFGIGIDPRQAFGAGTLPGSAGVQGALDIYRFIHTTSGADLTAGASTGDAVLGTGQYIGALTIDQSGTLKIQGLGSSAGSFASWASANNVTGGANGDSDKDGISNLVEYALNLNPAASDGAAGTYSGGTVSFAKRAEAVTNGDVTYAIEESDDLGVTDAWQVVTPTTNTPSAITYALPTGNPKKFARLKVTTP
ncbi:MAG: hypothetical protein J0M04_16885 [Verrucomicrobia bacterium]|nr:hypothetical protein [Verrucomicrobiota bacterium]